MYTPWSVTAGEVPTTAKWNILGDNDASFNDGTGIADNAIIARHIAANIVGSGKLNLETATALLPATFVTAASNTWQDSGLKVTLPVAGTWLIFANARIANSGSSEFGVVRLYNQTTAAVVADGDRIGNLAGPAGDLQTDTLIAHIVTTASVNNIIRLEIQPGGAYTLSVYSDNYGKSRILAIRIG